MVVEFQTVLLLPYERCLEDTRNERPLVRVELSSKQCTPRKPTICRSGDIRFGKSGNAIIQGPPNQRIQLDQVDSEETNVALKACSLLNAIFAQTNRAGQDSTGYDSDDADQGRQH